MELSILDNQMQKTILVTGGAGFIGSHLCKRLLKEGHRVLCLDDYSTGSPDNIKECWENPNFVFIKLDIRYPIHKFLSVLRIQCQGNLDQIYHLACPASPIQYQKNPIKTIETNFLGTRNILYLSQETGARVLLASTSEIYGEPLEHPQKESYRGNVNPIGPRSCYDEGKRIAETLMFDFHREHNIQISIARIFNTYGPHLAKDDGRVVSNFILQALEGKDITIYGDGSQTRSFCYVDDLLDGLVALMNHTSETGPVNLGNPDEYTIKELAETIISLTKSSSLIIYKSLPKDDPTRRKPDISKARQTLNWVPITNLNTGLQRTIQYFTRNALEVDGC